MSGCNVQRADVLSVQVHGDVVIKGDDRQRALRLRLGLKMYRPAVARLSALCQAFADVIVGDDGRLLLEEFVSSRMVFVVMRVDDEADRLIGNAFERLLNSFRQRSVLVVDDHDAIIAH